MIGNSKGFSFMLCNPPGWLQFCSVQIHQSRRFGGKTLVLDEILFYAETMMSLVNEATVRFPPWPHENYKTQPCAVVKPQYPSSKDRGELVNTVTSRFLNEASSAEYLALIKPKRLVTEPCAVVAAFRHGWFPAESCRLKVWMLQSRPEIRHHRRLNMAKKFHV